MSFSQKDIDSFRKGHGYILDKMFDILDEKSYYDRYYLCSNNNISIDILLSIYNDTTYIFERMDINLIIKHKNDKRLNWSKITENKQITFSDIQNHPELPWVKRSIIKRKDVSTEYLLKYLDDSKDKSCIDFMDPRKIPFKVYSEYIKNPSYLSQCILTIDDVLNNPINTFIWYTLSQNSSLHIQDMLNNKHLPWEWNAISRRYDLNSKIIDENIELNWDYELISKICNISLAYKYENKPFLIGDMIDVTIDDIKYFLQKKNINEVLTIGLQLNKLHIDDILNNLDIQWDFKFVTYNGTLTFTHIEKYPYIDWYWPAISSKEGITFDFIETHKDKIDWQNLSTNHSIDLKEAFKRGYPLDFKYMSLNPSLDIDFVLENLDKEWNYNWICGNKFIYDYNFCIYKMKKIKDKVDESFNKLDIYYPELRSIIAPYLNPF